MSSVSQRLRRLDDRVLGIDRVRTPDGWRKAMRRWWVGLVVAGAIVVLVVVQQAFLDAGADSLAILPIVVLLAYQSGRMRSEHERLQGRTTFMGMRRPDGL